MNKFATTKKLFLSTALALTFSGIAAQPAHAVAYVPCFLAAGTGTVPGLMIGGVCVHALQRNNAKLASPTIASGAFRAVSAEELSQMKIDSAVERSQLWNKNLDQLNVALSEVLNKAGTGEVSTEIGLKAIETSGLEPAVQTQLAGVFMILEQNSTTGQ